MDSSSDRLEPVDLLADEFMERQRRGEHPTVEQFCEAHPELADEIREVFPALLVMENVAPATSDLAVSKGTSGELAGKRLAQVGDYRVLREIGRGGMGVVYEAEQESLGRRVALKVLPRQAAGDEKSLLRFQQEARAAARMHHTNIVPVFEVGEDDDVVFYAMQLIHGQGLDLVINDLRQLRSEKIGVAQPGIDRNAPSLAKSLVTGQFDQERLIEDPDDLEASSGPDLPSALAETVTVMSSSTSTARMPGQSEISSAEDDRSAYFRGVAEIGLQSSQALAYAHARGIIHRDIKPSNLLLDTTGVVWITDFGLAKTGNSSMTQTGDLLGTIRYMSPERFKGQCDVRADVYSLGLTLYEMLVLKPAFESPDRFKLMNMVVQDEAVPPRSIDPRIPRDLETIVLKACDKDPRRRYQSADEMSDDLQRFIHDEPIHARRISLLERCSRWSRRNKAVAASLAIVASLVTCIAVGSTIVAANFRRMNQVLVVEQAKASESAKKAKAEAKRADAEAAKNERLAKQRQQQADAAIAAKQVADEARLESARQAELTRRSLYSAELNMSRYAAMAGEDAKSRMLLENWRDPSPETDLRGWEWYRQMDEVAVPVETLQIDNGELVLGVDWSPDGSEIAAARFNGLVSIVDGSSGLVRTSINCDNKATYSVEWSPDGRQIATGGFDGTLKIWNAIDGKLRKEFKLSGRYIDMTSWSPDGDRVATSDGDDENILVIDVSDGSRTAIGEAGTDRMCFDWNAKGDKVATAGDQIQVWDASTGKPLANSGEFDEQVVAIDWHPTLDRIASVGLSGTVRIWDFADQAILAELPDGDGSDTFGRIQWSPDGNRIAVALSSDRIDVIDASTGNLIQTFPLDSDTFFNIAWHPDQSRIAIGGRNGRLRVLDVAREPVIEFQSVTESLETIAWHPSGQRTATGGPTGVVELWDTTNRRRVRSLTDPGGELTRIAALQFDRTGTRIAAGGRLRDDIVIWNAETGDFVRRLEGHEYDSVNHDNGIRCMDWSEESNQIVAGGKSRHIYVWDFQTGVLKDSFRSPAPIDSVAWIPGCNGRYIACTSGKDFIVWDRKSSSRVIQETAARPIHDLALDPARQRIAICYGGSSSTLSGTGGAISWTYSYAEDEFQLAGDTPHQGPEQAIYSICFTQDGQRLIGGGYEGEVFVWDVSNGADGRRLSPITSFESTIDTIRCIRASGDQTQIAAVGDDGPAVVWDPVQAYIDDVSPLLLPGIDQRLLAGEINKDDLMVKARILSRQGNWTECVPTLEQLMQVDGKTRWFPADAWVLHHAFEEDLVTSHSFENHSTVDEFQLDKPLSLGESTAYWKPIELRSDTAIDFQEVSLSDDKTSAYVVMPVFAANWQDVGVIYSADDQSRLWLNGELIHESQGNTQLYRREHGVPIRLRPGWNTLLLKVFNNTGSHGFYFNVTDDDMGLWRLFYSGGYYEESLAASSRISNEFPDVPYPVAFQAMPLWKLGRYDEAKQKLQEAIQNPELAEIGLYASRYACWSLGLYDRVLRYTSKVIENHRPDDAEGFYFRGDVLARLRRFDEAMPDFEKAVELEPERDIGALRLLVIKAIHADAAECRELQDQMLTRFGDTEKPEVAERIAKGVLVGPTDAATLARVNKLLDVARAAGPNHRYRFYFDIASGFYECRQGQRLMDSDAETARSHFSRALKHLGRAKTRSRLDGYPENAMCDSLAAIALLHLGQRQRAVTAFNNVSKHIAGDTFTIPGRLLGTNWHDELISRHLYAEAGRLLHGEGHDPLLEGQYLLATGRPEEALGSFLSAIEQSPDSWYVRTEVFESMETGAIGAAPVFRSSFDGKETWEWASEEPPEGWMLETGVDAELWRQQTAPFGSWSASLAPPHRWPQKTELWVRKVFNIENPIDLNPVALVAADDEADIFINGVPALHVKHSDGVAYHRFSDEATAALRPGKNIIAVHAKDARGGRRFEMGLFLPQKEKSDLLAGALQRDFSESPQNTLTQSKLAARLGRWHEAALKMEQYAKYFSGDAFPYWQNAALMHLIAHRQGKASLEDYRRVCSEVIERYGDSSSPEEILSAILICRLTDDQPELPMLERVSPAELVERIPIAEATRVVHLVSPAYQAYREGRLDDAMRHAQSGLASADELEPFVRVHWKSKFLRATCWAIISMIESSRGNASEARQALEASFKAKTDQIGVDSDGNIDVTEVLNPNGRIRGDGLQLRLLVDEAEKRLSQLESTVSSSE